MWFGSTLEDWSVEIVGRSREAREEAVGIVWMADTRDLNFDHVVGMEGEESGRWLPGLDLSLRPRVIVV